MILDTGYIDTVRDLGVNNPQDESIQFRTVLQCAPLETDGYTGSLATPTENYTQYYYGAFLNGPDILNSTFTVPTLDSQYFREDGNPQSGGAGMNMILR